MMRRELLVVCGLDRAKSDFVRLGLDEPPAGVVARLRERGLVERTRRALTDEGKRLVREAFGISRVPSWGEMKRHAAALALGLAAGSIEAQRTFETTKGKAKLPAAILAQHFELPHTTSVRAVCEALLFAKLGLPAIVVKDARLLGHVLAQRAEIELRAGKFQLEPFAARVAAAVIGARGTKKDRLVEALARRWFTASPSATAPAVSSGAAAPGSTFGFDDTVRAGLSKVPPSGRYGDEKVFIASLWDTIRPQAPAEMDLQRFKRWLVEANAKQAVVLARADLVGAMDAAQVAASEIVDRGASFHFVLDHR